MNLISKIAFCQNVSGSINCCRFNMKKSTSTNAPLITLLIALVICTVNAAAQTNDAPGKPTKEKILLLGGTAHVGDGTVIEQCAIGIENGKFTLVADARLIRVDRTAYDKIIDITGQHVYPGFIAASTNMGLKEIGAVRATGDDWEVGSFNPHVRSSIAFNTDSRVIPTNVSNGILMAQVTPQGGWIQGTSSVLHLDGWNWEDALIKEDDAIHMSWPQLLTRKVWWPVPSRLEKNEDYDDDVNTLKNFFAEAQAYSEQGKPEIQNLRFEAMRGVFTKEKKVFIRCSGAKGITEAVRFGLEFDLDIVLVGARDAWRVADLLAANNIPVILNQVNNLPALAHSDYDKPYKTPAILEEAGVTFGISVMGWDGYWNFRTLPQQAGQAVAFGLDPEAAVAAISGNIATILGIEDEMGTISPEKDATFFTSSGDMLDVLTGNPTQAWIQGREVNLDDKQKRLYQKFKAKYDSE